MFHAVGLNVIDPRERKREVLDVSTRALKDMIAIYVVVEDRQYCSAHDTRARPKILRTLSPSRVYDTTPRHLY